MSPAVPASQAAGPTLHILCFPRPAFSRNRTAGALCLPTAPEQEQGASSSNEYPDSRLIYTDIDMFWPHHMARLQDLSFLTKGRNLRAPAMSLEF